jgi:purine nucleosidase
MRKIIIDTDTASDDAVAIIMALRSQEIHVEAITVVAGNVPLDLAVKNALISVEMADTYDVPVYKGASKPLFRELVTAEFAHGKNGMGDINLPTPKKQVEETNAVDALLDIISKNPGEIELIAIGPLTNIALAINKDIEIMKKLKKIYLMGGNGLGEGNITDYAEFNYFVDAHAAQIVSNLGIKIIQLPWDTCLDGVHINDEGIERLLGIENKLGKFCVDINSSLIELSKKLHNTNGFVVCDAGIIAIAIDPSIAEEYHSVYCEITDDDTEYYGQQNIKLSGKHNYDICTKMSYEGFMDLLVELLE